jgi:membrane dipeptidase
MSATPSTRDLHQSLLVVDTHVDTILRWIDLKHDLGGETSPGYMDIPKSRAGNFSAAFFACCVEPEHVKRGEGGKRLAQLLNGVHDFCAHHSADVVLARTVDDVRAAHRHGKFAVLLAIEGAQGIGEDLSQLMHFRDLGVSYISLSHFATNTWVDSSTDVTKHGGLSAVGKKAVAELNRLGIAVDVSHISDAAFWQVMELSSAPIIASHSSARALVDHPRNLTDDMIAAIAKKNGLIGVTWWPEYISPQFCDDLEKRARALIASDQGSKPGTTSAIATLLHYAGEDDESKYSILMDGSIRFPTLSDVADHIDHVVSVAGADHVCIGTDHGACNFEIQGLEDCSKLSALTQVLVDRGYKPEDIRAIMGENALEFFQRVQVGGDR